MNRWFYDDESERFMARRPSRDPEGEARELRELLARLPEVYDVSRMSDADVRRQVGHYRAAGRLPPAREGGSAENAGAIFPPAADSRQHAPEPARPIVQPTAAVPVVAAAVAAVTVARTPVTEEKRYTLLATLGYQSPHLFLNRFTAFRCKLENEFTGPESRRSGPIKPSDAAYYDVRRREMREGGYTLALTRPPLAARKLKALRTK